MPSAIDKLKEKAKGLKLRAEATAVILKAKPLLLKEKTWSKDRFKKIDQLEAKAEQLRDEKVIKIAEHMKSFATKYQQAIDQQIKLIKDVSILNSSAADIQKFMADMATQISRANSNYEQYRTKKLQLRNHVQANTTSWGKDLIDWFVKEKVTWKAAEKALGEVADGAAAFARFVKECGGGVIDLLK